MNDTDRIRPLLQAWVDRSLPEGSEETLAGVMLGVATVEQRSAARWRLSLSNAIALASAAGAVAMVALVIGLAPASRPGTGPPPPPSPSPTASPTALPETPPPASAEELVYRFIDAWTLRDGPAAAALFAEQGALKIVTTDSALGTYEESTAADPAEIADAVTGDRSDRPTSSAVGGVARQGAFLAAPFMTTPAGSSAATTAIAVLEVSAQNRIQLAWIFARTGDPWIDLTGPPRPDGGVPDWTAEWIDTAIAAIDAWDGPTHAATFKQDGVWRLAVPSFAWSEEYAGREAIASTTAAREAISFHVTRTGPVLQVGSLAAYPWILGDGGVEGFAVLQLDPTSLSEPEDFTTYEWVVGFYS